MAKRMHEHKEENRVVAKSRSTATNLAVSVSASSSSVNSPLASRSLGILKAPSRQIGFSGRPDVSANQNSNPDAASSSQGWRRDAQLDISTGRHVAAGKDQKYLNHQEKISTGEPVAPGFQEYPEDLQTPEDSEDSEPESRIWPHHFRKSPHCADHMENLFSITRKTYDRKPTLRSIKNQPLKSVKQLFRTTEKLIKDQVEITGFVHD